MPSPLDRLSELLDNHKRTGWLPVPEVRALLAEVRLDQNRIHDALIQASQTLSRTVVERDKIAAQVAALANENARLTDELKVLIPVRVERDRLWALADTELRDRDALTERVAALAGDRERLRVALLDEKHADGEDGLPCFCYEGPTGDNFEKRGITEHEARCLSVRAVLAATAPSQESGT